MGSRSVRMRSGNGRKITVNEAVSVLSIGAIIGGDTMSTRLWVAGISRLMSQVEKARVGVQSPLKLTVVFHVPGNVCRPEFVGIRTGSYSGKNADLEVDVAVPEVVPDDIDTTLHHLLLDVVDEAERLAVRRRLAADLSSLRRTAASLVAQPLNYGEGTWFCVPLEDKGWAVGVVARTSQSPGIILAYLFGPRRSKQPRLPELEGLRAAGAIVIALIHDLGLRDGCWPVIGELPGWTRKDWPVPLLVRVDLPRRHTYLRRYSDSDITLLESEELVDSEGGGYEKDTVYGRALIESSLTEMLADKPAETSSS